MPVCSVFGCTSRYSKKEPGLSFHRFPKHNYKTWAKKLNLKDFKWLQHKLVCSLHFKESDFDRSGFLVRLKDGSVPFLAGETNSISSASSTQSSISFGDNVNDNEQMVKSLHTVQSSQSLTDVIQPLQKDTYSKNIEMCAEWIKVVNRNDWNSQEESLLSSNHFAEKNLDRTSLSYAEQRPTDISTEFSSHQKQDNHLVHSKGKNDENDHLSNIENESADSQSGKNENDLLIPAQNYFGQSLQLPVNPPTEKQHTVKHLHNVNLLKKSKLKRPIKREYDKSKEEINSSNLNVKETANSSDTKQINKIHEHKTVITKSPVENISSLHDSTIEQNETASNKTMLKSSEKILFINKTKQKEIVLSDLRHLVSCQGYQIFTCTGGNTKEKELNTINFVENQENFYTSSDDLLSVTIEKKRKLENKNVESKNVPESTINFTSNKITPVINKAKNKNLCCNITPFVSKRNEINKEINVKPVTLPMKNTIKSCDTSLLINKNENMSMDRVSNNDPNLIDNGDPSEIFKNSVDNSIQINIVNTLKTMLDEQRSKYTTKILSLKKTIKTQNRTIKKLNNKIRELNKQKS